MTYMFMSKTGMHKAGARAVVGLSFLALSSQAALGQKAPKPEDLEQAPKTELTVKDANSDPSSTGAPGPNVVEKAFRDWRVICNDGVPRESTSKETTCQMLQTASAGKDGSAVFLLSVSPGKRSQEKTSSGAKSARHYAVVTVPSGVYLANGIEIRVDKRRPFKVLYEICDRVGCHAGFRLSGQVLSVFQKGYTAKVRVWTGKKKAVDFPVSLIGFTAAYRFYTSKISGKVSGS